MFCVFFFPFILGINCLMINVLVQSPLRLYFYFFLSIATMSFAGYFLVRSLLSSFPPYLRTFFRFDFVWLRLSVQDLYSRNFGALRLIHAPGISMGSEPYFTCACERSRCPRAPGEKAPADLKKLQQILTMVQLASNLRDN